MKDWYWYFIRYSGANSFMTNPSVKRLAFLFNEEIYLVGTFFMTTTLFIQFFKFEFPKLLFLNILNEAC